MNRGKVPVTRLYFHICAMGTAILLLSVVENRAGTGPVYSVRMPGTWSRPSVEDCPWDCSRYPVFLGLAGLSAT